MKIIILFLFVISASAQTASILKFDEKLVSKVTEVDFFTTEKRGFRDESGVVYFVQNDLQSIVAFEKEKILWKVNVISLCGNAAVGKNEIRFLKLEKDTLIVIYGKHNFASVAKFDGKILCQGSD